MMLITFEGTEGSGKSTQIELLARWLREQSHDVVTTREPGGTTLGDRIRTLLLEADERMAPETEAYLMTAARAEHVRRTIGPALQRGAIVISDRFVDSTLAYQGAGRGLPVEELVRLQALAIGDTVPDITFLLDIDVEVGLARKQSAPDSNHMDHESLDFHQRVAGWYREAAANDPDRWRRVDGNQTVEDVQADVRRAVEVALGARRARVAVEGGAS